MYRPFLDDIIFSMLIKMENILSLMKAVLSKKCHMKQNEVFFMLRAYGTINRFEDEGCHSTINFVRKIENRFAVSIFEPQTLPRSRCVVLVSIGA